MNQPSAVARGGPAAARVTVAVLLAAAVAATAAPPAEAGPAPPNRPVPSTDTTPPRVEDVRFSRASVRVAGLALVPVTVSVRITDASGVDEVPHAMTPSPSLVLSPVPGFRSLLRPVLTRTSGTPTNGVWSATVNVPSTWNGTVRITTVNVADRAGNVLNKELTGALAPALRVRGTHRPALTFRYSLLDGGGFRVHGRAYFTDTGRPIARLPLGAALGSPCDLEGGARNNMVTDRRGRYERRWENVAPDTEACVALIGRAAPGQNPSVLAYRLGPAPQPVIPDAALLQPADLYGATPEPVTDDSWSPLRAPRPCADRPLPGTALRRANRAITAWFGVEGAVTPTVVLEHLATYRPDGAQRYLRELRRALATCNGSDPEGGRWTVRATGVAGDESLLLRRRTYLDHVATYHDTYLVVARTGSVVIIVADTGWEFGSGDEALVRELGLAAVRRAQILNK
ncbi:MAG TPA: hypothetical protein VES42_20070 [Pilimelia sp.]|nr:hypothetical protein [Pilimelia sp.]